MGKYTFINRAEVPVILAQEPLEIGASVLNMIYSFYDSSVSMEELKAETVDERGYITAASLMRSAKKHGFDCHGYKKETEDLRGMEMPCILHWNFNCFVVLEGFEADRAHIIHPVTGRGECTFEELDASFTGVVLTVKPLAQEED